MAPAPIVGYYDAVVIVGQDAGVHQQIRDSL
jgi:hypothetical protein